MVNKKISELVDGGAVKKDDIIPIVRDDGKNYKANINSVLTDIENLKNSIVIEGQVDYYNDLPLAIDHNSETWLVEKYSILTPTKLTGLYYCNGVSWDRRSDKVIYSLESFSGVNKLVKTNDSNRQIIETEIEIDENNNLDLKNNNINNVNSINYDLSGSSSFNEGQQGWDALAQTVSIGLQGGSVLQLGQELHIRAKAVGSNILNGQVCYTVSSSSAFPGMSLASNDDYNKAFHTISIATQNVNQNQAGYFTTFGIVRDLNTNAFNEGDILYLGVNGDITNIKPTPPDLMVRVGYCIKKDATSGEILVNIHDQRTDYQNLITKEPTGFDIPENVIITGNTDRTVTLTGISWNAYYLGLKNSTIISGWTSLAHGTDTSKVYFLIYDGTNISWVDTSTLTENFYYNLQIAMAFYNATDANWVYQRECHGLMQWQVHRAEHSTIGTYKLSGGTLADYNLNSTTVGDRRPLISATVIRDEDLTTTNPLLADNGPYTQFYLSGADSSVNFITGKSDIIPLLTNQPYYNQFTGGIWQQTLMSESYYANIWILALPMALGTNSQKLRYIFIQPQAEFITLTNAQAENINSISLGNLRNLTPETIAITKITIRYVGGNWQLIEVNNLSGTKTSQVSSPAGNYLSAIATLDNFNGIGTTASPLKLGHSTESYILSLTDISLSGKIYIATDTLKYWKGFNVSGNLVWRQIFIDNDTAQDIYGDKTFNNNIEIKGKTISFLEIKNKTDNYTLELTDTSSVIELDSALAKTITIPLESNVNFALGTIIGIIQKGDGQVSIIGDVGVNVFTSKTLNLKQKYSVVSLLKNGADSWYLFGDLEE